MHLGGEDACLAIQQVMRQRGVTEADMERDEEKETEVYRAWLLNGVAAVACLDGLLTSKQLTHVQEHGCAALRDAGPTAFTNVPERLPPVGDIASSREAAIAALSTAPTTRPTRAAGIVVTVTMKAYWLFVMAWKSKVRACKRAIDVSSMANDAGGQKLWRRCWWTVKYGDCLAAGGR